MWMFTNTVGRFRTQSLFTAWGWRQIDMATQRPLDFVWCFQCAKRREMNRTECGSFRIHGFGFGFGFRLRPLNAYAKHAHYVETIAGAKLAWAESGTEAVVSKRAYMNGDDERWPPFEGMWGFSGGAICVVTLVCVSMSASCDCDELR